jgi:ABC-type branched-subunit amino acid transport system substrate-binding protein
MIIFLAFKYNAPQKDEIMDISLFNSKVCICTLGKEENKYIIEFIEYYKNMGVDKIYLYDNNNIDGEHFEEVIDNYIKSGFVEIVDCRGKKSL